MYQAMGFTEIDVSNIVFLLRHSKNPPVDLVKAEEGFGVKAKAPCGCYIEVDIKGTIFIRYSCPDHPDGIPNIKPLKEKRSELITLGDNILPVSCGDCGTNLIQTVFFIKKGKKNSQIGIEIKCPHCGLISYEKKLHPNSRLRKIGHP